MAEEITYGFAWYKPEQWERLREVADDPSEIEDTYEEWRAQAEDAIAQLRAEGYRFERVIVDIEELRAWCDQRDLPVNSEARADYVGVLLRQRDGQP